jgi:muconate cycloisomerase
MGTAEYRREVQSWGAAKIARVETIPLAIPFHTPFKIAQGPARPVAEILLVRLHTDEGKVGVGETQAWRRQGSSETLAGLIHVIEHHFAPHVIGQSPFAMAGILSRLEESVYHSAYAQAAVGDALWDLQGKLLGVPVFELIGGKCRDTVSTCATLTMKSSLEETMDGAARAYGQGYRSFTVKIGLDAREDLRNVQALRERLGEDVVIRVDANAGMEFDGALALLNKLEPFGIDAAEQVLPIEDLEGMAELARRVDIPLMADESVATPHDLLRIIGLRAAGAIHTKVAKNGGLWGTRRLWEMAQAAGVRIFPGNHPSTSIGTASVLHLAAAWPGSLMEGPFPIGLSVLVDDVVADPIRMQGPLVPVPDRPGWGYELDEARLERWRADR